MFREYVYGRVPESDALVNYRVVFEDRGALQGTAVEKEVVMEVCSGDDTLEISMLLFSRRTSPGRYRYSWD